MIAAISAGLLLASCLYMHHLAPLLFTISFYILFSSLYRRFSYQHLAVWAFFFTVGSLLACAQVIQDHASGCLRQLLFVSICSYLAAVCVFIACAVGHVTFNHRHVYGALLPLSLTIFFCFSSGYALLPLGAHYGFPVLNPLVPLIYQSSYVRYCIGINQWGTLFIVLMIVNMLANAWQEKRWYIWVSMATLLVIIFFPLPEKFPREDIQQLAKRIKSVDTSTFTQNDDAWDRAQKIADALAQVPDNTVACLPESAFPYPLNEYSVFIALWHQAAPFNCTVVLGAHAQKKEGLFNSLYFLKEGRIIQIYDKKECLPLAETQSNTTFFLQGICQFFSTTKKQFCNSRADPSPFELTHACACIPLICSELLCRDRDPYPMPVPIVCITNDSWFSWPITRQTMALTARLRAISWQRTIIYCAYSCSFIVAPDGSMIDL